jgi:hypothetical protein
MDDFFIQKLDEISQMDEKMLASLDWCRTCALGSKI